MVDVLELAKYLLYLDKEKAKRDGDEAAIDMTPMKLQKLLYYCQGYSLGLTGKLLFPDTIEAWSYGPVVRRVYKEYQQYRGACLPLDLAANSEPSVDEYAAGIAELVMRDKGKYSAWALADATHLEPAWKEASHDAPLSHETMQKYFSNILNEEMSPEKESQLWASVGREPTSEEWQEIALSL